jgi:hypothetical protein
MTPEEIRDAVCPQRVQPGIRQQHLEDVPGGGIFTKDRLYIFPYSGKQPISPP